MSRLDRRFGETPVERPRTDGSGGDSPAEVRHRTLTELKQTVKRHPAVDESVGVRDDGGRFRELDVTFDPAILDVDADRAGLRIEWRPRPDPDEFAYFVFHYYDSTGRDFGWHREPNPHVDGLEHYQERDSPEVPYEYEPANFESTAPVSLCWEVLGRIEERLVC